MKKIFFMLSAALVAAVSCSVEGGYSEQYQYVSTFDYSESIYDKEFGSDSLYFDENQKMGIVYYDLAFCHKVADDKSFKGGFLLSYLKAAGLGEKPKDHVVNSYKVAGPPMEGGILNTYAVFTQNNDPQLMPEHDVTFLSQQYGTFKVSSCWVNNTEEVYEAVKEKFENGDKLVLTATGYLDGRMTGSAEINLALPDTTIYNWTKFDLEKLGSVDAIDFELYSSRSDLPQAFCLDELTGLINIEY